MVEKVLTREQAQTKLSLLPLLLPVDVDYSTNMEDEPVLAFSYAQIPGPGSSRILLSLAPSEENLRDLVANLPLLPADRLASLAIMLAAPQVT